MQETTSKLVKNLLHLQCFKANMISNGAVFSMILLIRMHVVKVYYLVSFKSAFQEEDKKST